MQVAEDMDEAVLAQLEDAQRPSEAAATRRCLDEFWDFTDLFFCAGIYQDGKMSTMKENKELLSLCAHTCPYIFYSKPISVSSAIVFLTALNMTLSPC